MKPISMKDGHYRYTIIDQSKQALKFIIAILSQQMPELQHIIHRFSSKKDKGSASNKEDFTQI